MLDLTNTMALKRRDFLKLGGISLVTASLYPQDFFSQQLPGLNSQTLLREQLFSEEFPFPYDDTFFTCAERVYNIRRKTEDAASWLANVSLLLKEGKKLDIKILVSETQQGLAQPREVQTYYGVESSLDTLITGFDSSRLYYQVQYRENQESWKALSPKSFKLPNVDLEKKGEIKIIFLADDHTFDDADYQIPSQYKDIKLSGDYINEFLKNLRNNPNWQPTWPLSKLTNGLFLAKAIRYIMAFEDPDFIINLGDTNGIGAGYRWKDWGLPYVNLTENDYNLIAKTLWLRMRKMYSGLTPSIPMLIAMGNHDGEEGWNAARFKSKEWRKKYFPLPDLTTYPEGGHGDGNYYAFSWGSDENNQGGLQFIILDVTAFAGEIEPPKVEKWTLGQDQLNWLEGVLQNNERDWSFACFHHVLGGWPAGPGEEDKVNIAYGRGPLFNASDYSDFCNPNNVEQVKITEMAKTWGLRGFIYGHDHIFKATKIGKGLNEKDILGVCCGSTKSIGETGWWRGNLWTKYYGNAFKSPPDFWGPSGITKLTVKSEETRVDYILTSRTSYSNVPTAAKAGDILSRTILVTPSPSIKVDKTEIILQGVEGRCQFPSQVVRVKNGGGGVLNYQVKSKASWLSVFPESGKSWIKWKAVTLSISAKNFQAGTYDGIISIESYGTANSPQQVKVKLVILDPPIYAPVDFKGVRESKTSLFYYPDDVIVLSWKAHRLNKNIQKYRIYLFDDQGKQALVKEVSANTFRYTYKNARRGKSCRFAITAVDVKNREGEAAYTTVD